MTDLVKLYEKRVLTTVRLTQYQKTVLALVAAAPDGIVPDEDISKDRNMSAARKLLVKLGLLVNEKEDQYSISDAGQKVAKDEGIVDDGGQLTELGNKLAYAKTPSSTPAAKTPGPSDTPAEPAFANTAGPSADVPETVNVVGSLLVELLADI